MRKISPILLLALLLSACGTAPVPTATPSMGDDATTALPATATVEPSPTPEPEKVLTVCLTEEPQTLYLYGSPSRSMWNVLEAIYDGPIDQTQAGPVPVILEGVPSLEDGSAEIKSMSVQAGDPVVDADGRYTALASGLKVYPSGCRGSECAVTWDGVSPLSMDQYIATYTLKPGITWSDGSPLRAQDSVFSYRIASDPATPVSRLLSDRTMGYEALDDTHVRWTGVPGYLEARFEATFWLPLPEHILNGIPAADLLTDERSARAPMGWGAFTIDEWKAGEYIRVRRSPAYFRASEKLPRVDVVEFRFSGNPADSALMKLVDGQCDVVDRNDGFLGDMEELINTENNGRLKMLLAQGPQWEMLAFGIHPAAYDDGYQSGADRPDILGDARVRSAIAQCIDRPGLAAEMYQNRGQAVTGLIPPGNPLAVQESFLPASNPEAAKTLLDEAGWLDQDNDPATPRTARQVSNVPDGSPLQLTLMTTNAPLRQETARRITAQLAECGIGLQTQTLDPAGLFAPGPEGPLFGRQFDLALFSFANGSAPVCRLFTSAQVPNSANLWTGSNLTGFSDPAYDAACSGYIANPNDAEKAKAAEQAFGQALPILPLYYHLQVAITAPDICGLTLDIFARSLFGGIETAGPCP